MKFVYFCLACLVTPLLAWAQASPEEQTIADILLAHDFSTVEKHLPEPLRAALASMDKAGRDRLLSRPMAMAKEKGLRVSPATDGNALLEFDVELPEAEIKHFQLRTLRRISNGTEAVLMLALVPPEKSWGDAEVWMKLEEGEWRVRELKDPNGYGSVDLEDADMIAELTHAPRQANDRSAIANLRELATALVSYSAEYFEMPYKIDALGGLPDGDVNKDHAKLVDSELASTHVQSGYKFEYQRTSVDSYQLRARPLDFGKSGRKNFFLDDSGIIRFTEDDRPATLNDRTLGFSRIPGMPCCQ